MMSSIKKAAFALARFANNCTIVPTALLGGGVLCAGFFRKDAYKDFYATKCELVTPNNTNVYLRAYLKLRDKVAAFGKTTSATGKPYYLVTAVMANKKGGLVERTFVVQKCEKLVVDQSGRFHTLPLAEWAHATKACITAGRSVIDRHPNTYKCRGQYLTPFAAIFPIVKEVERHLPYCGEVERINALLKNPQTKINRCLIPLYFDWVHRIKRPAA